MRYLRNQSNCSSLLKLSRTYCSSQACYPVLRPPVLSSSTRLSLLSQGYLSISPSYLVHRRPILQQGPSLSIYQSCPPRTTPVSQHQLGFKEKWQLASLLSETRRLISSRSGSLSKKRIAPLTIRAGCPAVSIQMISAK